MTSNLDDLSLALYEDEPEAIAEMRRRQEQAEEHEKKLKIIQETVPTRTFNVCGSSAGAGSGDFHQYRMIRRREQARLKRMEADAIEEEKRLYREQRLTVLKESEDRRTAKNRNKRMKQKIRKKSKKKSIKVLDVKKQGQSESKRSAAEDEPNVPEQVALD
eukprot:g8918.t1